MTSPDSAGTPPVPPVPTYGEYASPDHAEAARQAELARQQGQQQPHYGQAQQYGQQPQYGHAPQYGQPQYQQQPYGSQPYNPNGAVPWGSGPRPLRVADMVVSIALLFIGGITTLIAIFNTLTIDTQLQEIYDSEGISGTYSSGAGGAIATAVIAISHVVLLIVAILVTTILVRKRRVSFWMPLTAGAIAAIIFWVTFIVLIASDPAIIDYLTAQSGG